MVEHKKQSEKNEEFFNFFIDITGRAGKISIV